MPHEDRGVVDDRVVDAGRERLLQAGHRGADIVRCLNRIRAGPLKHADRDGIFVVEQAAHRVAIGADLHASDVADARDLAVRRRANDDIRELFFRRQPPLRINGQLERRIARRGGSAEDAGGDLKVLLADGAHDVRRRELSRREFVRIEPDAHAVLARAEHLRASHSGQSRQLVLHAQVREVREIQHVVSRIGREQMHDHDEVGRGLLCRHPDPLHFRRQPRQRLRDAVLHLHLRVVEVRADGERDGQRHAAVGRRLREHVEHALDAVELLLERTGDGFGDHFRIRAGIRRAHDNGRRRDARVLTDRQLEQRDAAADENQQRENRREDRASDEKLSQFHNVLFVVIPSVARDLGAWVVRSSFIVPPSRPGPSLRSG